MTINTLYFGFRETKWNNSELVLLDRSNIEKIIKSEESIDCCTSIDDLSFYKLYPAFENSQAIDLTYFNFHDLIDRKFNNDFNTYGHFLYLCNKFKTKLQNVSEIPVFPSTVYPSSIEKCLWTAGCSFTAGVGVDRDQRWGTLLSEKLGIPELCLAMPGASITYSANTILQSDIKPNDLVVWGLTNTNRVELAKDWSMWATTSNNYTRLPRDLQYYNLDYFESTTNILKSRDSILQVINFCSKIKAKLVLANVLDISWISTLFNNYENFIDLTTEHSSVVEGILTHIDYGSDNCHPGPLQHQYYAQKLHDFIVKQQYI